MVKSLRLGVAGLGTVGIGLLDLLARHGPEITRRAGRPIEVTAICARDRSKNRGHDLTRLAWFDDPNALARSESIDVFVELMGGEGDPAKSAVTAALNAC
jgi:homoserine dehydrogenase